MGASSPFEAFALALLSSSSLIRASSAAYGSVTAAAPSFWASLNLGCACMVWIPAASLDPATAFWLKNAALISMALAKAQDSMEIPDNRFTASPLNRFQGGIPICNAHAKTALDRCTGLL